jgi:hypothetical protein
VDDETKDSTDAVFVVNADEFSLSVIATSPAMLPA